MKVERKFPVSVTEDVLLFLCVRSVILSPYDVGQSVVVSVDTTFSWEIFYSFNRKIIDNSSPRHFFVNQPVSLKFEFEGKLKASIPLYPQTGNSATQEKREYLVGKGSISITSFF